MKFVLIFPCIFPAVSTMGHSNAPTTAWSLKVKMNTIRQSEHNASMVSKSLHNRQRWTHSNRTKMQQLLCTHVPWRPCFTIFTFRLRVNSLPSTSLFYSFHMSLSINAHCPVMMMLRWGQSVLRIGVDGPIWRRLPSCDQFHQKEDKSMWVKHLQSENGRLTQKSYKTFFTQGVLTISP